MLQWLPAALWSLEIDSSLGRTNVESRRNNNNPNHQVVLRDERRLSPSLVLFQQDSHLSLSEFVEHLLRARPCGLESLLRGTRAGVARGNGGIVQSQHGRFPLCALVLSPVKRAQGRCEGPDALIRVRSLGQGPIRGEHRRCVGCCHQGCDGEQRGRRRAGWRPGGGMTPHLRRRCCIKERKPRREQPGQTFRHRKGLRRLTFLLGATGL